MTDERRIGESGADGPAANRAQALLVDFLSDHDAACPVCGYSLRGLGRPTCPECKQDLRLTVSAARLRIGLLLVALAPGCFSGIAACFLLIPTLGAYLEDGMIIPPLVAAILFGWCSGVFAIVLAVKRTRFLALGCGRKRWFALGVWGVHFVMLALLGVWMDPYIT